MDKKLYKVTTRRNLEFYVVATSWDEAAKLVTDALDEAEYCFSSDREVVNVELLREERFLGNKHFFSGGEQNYFISGFVRCKSQ